jgi:hypothetical protein
MGSTSTLVRARFYFMAYATTGTGSGQIVRIRKMELRKRSNGKLIVDGAIEANHIKTRTIVAQNIAVDTITANEIMARTVTANEIAANTITANEVATDILIANEMFARDRITLGSIELDRIDGITIDSPMGVTHFPVDGSTASFAGNVETGDLTVNGGLTLNKKTNTVNGSLGLANVVVPPTTLPGTQKVWPYTAPIGTDTHNLSEWDANNWMSVHLPSNTIRVYAKTTGAHIVTRTPTAGYIVLGATRSAGYIFMNCFQSATGDMWLCRMLVDGTGFVALTKFANYNVLPSSTHGIGVNGSNIVVAYVNPNKTTAQIIEYNTAGVQQSSDMYTLGFTSSGFIYGVGRGPYGPNNEDSYWLIVDYATRIYPVATKTLGWSAASAESIKGAVVSPTDGKFVYLGYNTYRIYQFALDGVWDDTATESITYAWYDSTLAGSGKHETTPSPPKLVTDMSRWAWLRVTTPSPSNTGQDDSPDSVAIYINGKRQPDLPTGVTTADYGYYDVNGAAPKDTNEFVTGVGVTAYPGELISGATFVDGVTPRMRFKGDGTGHWGDLVVDGNGKATIGGDSGWIAVLSFGNLWENYGSPYATAAYRKIGNRVFLRGLVRSGTSAVPIFTLPVGYRPPFPMLHMGISNSVARTSGAASTGTAHTHLVTMTSIATRINVDANGAVQLGDTSAATGFISLEGISFLVD